MESINKIIDPETNKIYQYCSNGEPGKMQMKLYNKLVSIQTGDSPDEFGWISFVE